MERHGEHAAHHDNSAAHDSVEHANQCRGPATSSFQGPESVAGFGRHPTPSSRVDRNARVGCGCLRASGAWSAWESEPSAKQDRTDCSDACCSCSADDRLENPDWMTEFPDQMRHFGMASAGAARLTTPQTTQHGRSTSAVWSAAAWGRSAAGRQSAIRVRACADESSLAWRRLLLQRVWCVASRQTRPSHGQRTPSCVPCCWCDPARACGHSQGRQRCGHEIPISPAPS